MAKGDRRDGKLIKQSNPLNAMFPYIMVRRNESLVYFSTDVNVEKLLSYIENQKSLGKKITFFQCVLVSLARTFRERPQLNRFLIGRRLYERENIDINFIAKREMSDSGEETNVTVRFKKEDNLNKMIEKITGEIKQAKTGAVKEDDKVIAAVMSLPRFLLVPIFKLLVWLDYQGIFPNDLARVDPLRCSVFVANLGSVGIDAPFHHLFEWATCSVFACIGKIGKKVVCLDDGTITSKTMVEIKFTIDERISDGFYLARSLELFKKYLENPELLFEKGGDTN